MKNRKQTLATLVIGCLIGAGLQIQPAYAAPSAPVSVFNGGSHAKAEFDQNLHDTLLTLLSPALDQAVKKVYGKPTQYDLFNAKIETIKRPQSGGFHFIVTVSIQTFEGAHSPPYGKDIFTFDITPEKTTLLSSSHNKVEARF